MAKYTNLLRSQTCKYGVIWLLIFSSFSGFCDTLTVHFLYGSKPARGYKKTERHWFGGIHGGHVTIQVGNYVYGLAPGGRNHIFSHGPQTKNSVFQKEHHNSWASDTASLKYLSVKIAVDSTLADSLNCLFTAWTNDTPYDYAFFGMRCASAAYHGLSHIGLVKKRGKWRMVYRFFYPKLVRKYLVKKAKRNNWKVLKHKGRESRKWEGD